MHESIVFLLRVQCRRKESSRSLSHLLMSFLFVYLCLVVVGSVTNYQCNRLFLNDRRVTIICRMELTYSLTLTLSRKYYNKIDKAMNNNFTWRRTVALSGDTAYTCMYPVSLTSGVMFMNAMATVPPTVSE